MQVQLTDVRKNETIGMPRLDETLEQQRARIRNTLAKFFWHHTIIAIDLDRAIVYTDAKLDPINKGKVKAILLTESSLTIRTKDKTFDWDLDNGTVTIGFDFEKNLVSIMQQDFDDESQTSIIQFIRG
jgi:hypothetical protein